MNLIDVKDMLNDVDPKIQSHHYAADKIEDQFIVWSEFDEDDAQFANGRKTNQVIKGLIVYFTKTEFDPIFDKIQEALNSSDLSKWSLAAVDYDKDTKHIRYQWIFKISIKLE